MSGPLSRRLCELLDRVVALDPTATRSLRRLEGRSLGVALRGPGMRVVLAVKDGHMVPGDPDGDVGAWIKATPGSLISLAASGGRAVAGQLEMSGDGETAARFQEFFRGLSPDWEEGLTRVFGDVLGVQIARGLRGGGELVRQAGYSLSRNVSDYLREESRQLVSQPELDEFLDQVDDLRDDVERLEARVRRLADRP
jgi:ubiquinone biosynthesis protein UbiJ